MKPYLIMHMMSALDGRILVDRWPGGEAFNDVYEEVHRELGGDAWLVGSTTMAEFAQGEPRPIAAEAALPRTTWKAPGVSKGPYAIGLDRTGKLQLNRATVNGDPLVMVLTHSVSDDHLAALRRDGVSYIFAGQSELDLALALETLAAEFGLTRLLLEGGGTINGAFLDAGLIDEISHLVVPVVDGAEGVPTIAQRASGEPLSLELVSVTQPGKGMVHLRYTIKTH